MGTHPIFESDFDCLTDGFRSYLQLFDWCQWGDYCARSSSRTNRWLGADRGWIILKSWGANQITSERIERKNPEAEKYEENKRLGESTELQQIPEEWACHLAAWHFEELKKASPNKQNCNPATIPQVSASQQILSLCDNHNYLNPTKSSHLFKLWAFIACIGKLTPMDSWCLTGTILFWNDDFSGNRPFSQNPWDIIWERGLIISLTQFFFQKRQSAACNGPKRNLFFFFGILALGSTVY